MRNKATLLSVWLNRRGKYGFIGSLPPKAKVLDVGCGNNSPSRFKDQRPDCQYIGLDIGDYCQKTDPREYANEYILAQPEDFADAIRHFEGQLDAVISSHNIEHCEAPEEVLDAILKCLKPGGKLYIAFPCEESVHFPKRSGTLNFFDDSTHRVLPNWQKVISKIEQCGFVIEYKAKRQRAPALAAAGLLVEPVSALRKRVITRLTWSFWGFESVIWASRPKA